ncbi:hypothetical protein NDN08_003142 [Rhodosorus marinus]|uniref:RWP-RK domain-containing protein n=1 Tax=Rhodosorus marinus TaxID=101924 RepID=A0AAV8UZY7_9RHOD|nr:hypothetical protein NDN08_003142 [Rhodosorus marinus]
MSFLDYSFPPAEAACKDADVFGFLCERDGSFQEAYGIIETDLNNQLVDSDQTSDTSIAEEFSLSSGCLLDDRDPVIQKTESFWEVLFNQIPNGGSTLESLSVDDFSNDQMRSTGSTGFTTQPQAANTMHQVDCDHREVKAGAGWSVPKYGYLRDYFHLPRAEAARRLRISVTLLKRRCRRAGISRWPYRKIRAIRERMSKLEGKLCEEDTHWGRRSLRSKLSELSFVLEKVQEDPNTPLPDSMPTPL